MADTHPDGPDLVRKRPGMYIGDTGPRGLQHLCLELIGNSIDQFLLHRATTVSVDLDDGWLTVSDDGPGISVEGDERGLSFLESVFTSLHHTPTRDGPRAHVHVTHSGLGVGLAPVSALSERLEVESHRDGLCHRIAFARGVTVEPLQLVGKSDRQGLRIRFRPDPEILQTPFDATAIEDSVRQFAFLSPRLTWHFQKRDVSRPQGLVSFLADSAEGKLEAGSAALFSAEMDGVGISFAVGLCQRQRSEKARMVSSWVNLTPTREGGSHEKGLLEGLTDALPAWRELEPRFIGAVHVLLADPRFEGPTRSRLAVPMTRPLVREFVASELSKESDLRITWLEALSRLDK
ncbi:MAG: hypothetical protein JNM69_42900 [Archangium sp.]|nr:hypothetical protein [Archangium sp.]